MSSMKLPDEFKVLFWSQKYKNDFNDRLFLEQLIYLDNINTSGIKILKGDVLTKDKVKEFFTKI